jgi:hypothetical protein
MLAMKNILLSDTVSYVSDVLCFLSTGYALKATAVY